MYIYICVCLMEITGTEFNKQFKGIPLYKFTNHEETHYGAEYIDKYKYKDGINIDPNPFDISEGRWSKGSLYFASPKDITLWLDGSKYVRDVIVPNNARVCVYSNRIKADKIILGPRIKIIDSNLLNDEDLQKQLVSENGCAITYINHPTEEVKRIAVQEDGSAIQYIENPSEEVKRLAIIDHGANIRYIKDPSVELQKMAIMKGCTNIQYIENPSEEVRTFCCYSIMTLLNI